MLSVQPLEPFYDSAKMFAGGPGEDMPVEDAK